ncbi:MAG TPA: hypothetical protein VM870_10920 [Pyrinomonadaceae bacterium]|nr:hypothetical protein [Pyrinomonadaceae bacterium]
MNYFNYFTEIEDTFIRRRGRHLLLSPMDWALIESWKAKGIPLFIALRGIEKSFDSHESKPRRRSVKTLFYCQEEVEAQYDEWLESQTGASRTAEVEGGATPTAAADTTTPGGNNTNGALPFPRETIVAHLAQAGSELLAARRRRAADHGGDELGEALARAAGQLAELRQDFESAARPNAQNLEDALTRLEELLDRAVRASLPPAEIERERASAEKQLRAYKDRMERQTYEQTCAHLLTKTLRQRAGVPRLSLFYL